MKVQVVGIFTVVAELDAPDYSLERGSYDRAKYELTEQARELVANGVMPLNILDIKDPIGLPVEELLGSDCGSPCS